MLEGKEIARIKLQGALHILQPFIVLPLPAPDVAGQLKDMRIVRQRPPRRIEFLQSGAVIQVHPVKIFSAREVGFSSIGPKAKGCLDRRFGLGAALRCAVEVLEV